jgi:phosphopantetheinyl transferase (holo-ACP synthase)
MEPIKAFMNNIGIDLTRISRWAEMPESRRQSIADRYMQISIEPLDMAKWWVCHEAIIKCLGTSPKWRENSITFPPGQAPQYQGDHGIKLSLSHEGDLITAVALCMN